MSIFPQAWSQVFARGRDIPFLDGVSLHVRGTRIAGRNVTLPGHWCHLVRIGKDLHDRLGAALAFRTIGRIFENSRKSEPLHIHKTPVAWSDRYGETDRGRSKPRNQRWIDFLRSTGVIRQLSAERFAEWIEFLLGVGVAHSRCLRS